MSRPSWLTVSLSYLAAFGAAVVVLLWRGAPWARQLAPQALTEEPWREAVRAASGASVPATIREQALAAGLDPYLVAAIIEAESGFRPEARSEKGAVGLMQVLPETARMFGIREHEGPRENIRAGCQYLRWLFDDFGSDVELVLAAYNAGPGAVYRYGGVPPFRETQNFVRRVKEAYRRLSGMDLQAVTPLF